MTPPDKLPLGCVFLTRVVVNKFAQTTKRENGSCFRVGQIFADQTINPYNFFLKQVTWTQRQDVIAWSSVDDSFLQYLYLPRNILVVPRQGTSLVSGIWKEMTVEERKAGKYQYRDWNLNVERKKKTQCWIRQP